MKPVLQRRKGSAPGDPAQARLTLGVFGKHPGWDDHILGIGAETETLVRIRQGLYVQGIGGQIDSGVWEKLEPDKRLEGYDHTFLWLLPDHIAVGLMWSSRDGKGRAKYPMVLCIDAEGLSPACVLHQLLPGLELLRQACKATTSAEQVTRDCSAAQEQLRALLTRGELTRTEGELSAEAKRNLLQRPELGPDQVGLRRVLHELGTNPNARSRHVRLPLATNSQPEGISFWTEFLVHALPEADSLLLIARSGCDWLDAVVGEPASSDLFCLQASRKAVPLASEIPYDLPPESRERMSNVEARFLGADPPPVPAAPAARTEPRRTEPEPAALQPPVGRGKRSPLWLVAGALVVLAAVAGLWLSQSGRTPQSPPPVATTNEPPGQSADEAKYLALLKEGQAAFERKDYTNALAKAELALSIKHDDSAATTLKAESQAQLKLAVDAVERNRMFAVALAETTNAWQRGEAALRGGQYDLALSEFSAASNQCAKARELGDAFKPNQLLALLATRSAAVQNAKNQAMANTQQFAAVMREATNAWQRAEAALQNSQYQAALTELNTASNLCVNARVLVNTGMVDRFAAVLEARRAAVQQASQNSQAKAEQYASAMTEATNAWTRAEQAARAGRYDTALTELGTATNRCALARGLGDNALPDRLSLALEARRKELQAAKEQLQRAQDQFAKGQYDAALAACDSQPGNQVFQDLKTRIIAERNVLSDYNTRFTQGDYAFLDSLKDASYRDKPPFTSLYANGESEKGVLVQLAALKQANNATELKKKLADPALAGLAVKPPFAALHQWADAATADAPTTPALLEKLESRLEVLSVWFNVLSPKKALTPEGKAERRLSGSLTREDTDKYVNEVRELKKQFQQGGWLTPAREQELNALEDTIRTRL